MRAQLDKVRDPLLAGFFSTSDVTRLLGVNHARIRGWLNGYPNSYIGPIVQRDFAGTRTISFLDLMELRFIKYFRGEGVPMQTLRRAVEQARIKWNVKHPLAMYHEHYLTDRRQVFAQAAEEEEDEVTWNLATGQLQIWSVIERTIAKGVKFEPSKHYPVSWKPRPKEFDQVVVDPRFAFGRPTIEGTRVPTMTLFRQWRAEGSTQCVAKWFNVPESAVDAAIEYQLATAT